MCFFKLQQSKKEESTKFELGEYFNLVPISVLKKNLFQSYFSFQEALPYRFVNKSFNKLLEDGFNFPFVFRTLLVYKNLFNEKNMDFLSKAFPNEGKVQYQFFLKQVLPERLSKLSENKRADFVDYLKKSTRGYQLGKRNKLAVNTCLVIILGSFFCLVIFSSFLALQELLIKFVCGVFNYATCNSFMNLSVLRIMLRAIEANSFNDAVAGCSLLGFPVFFACLVFLSNYIERKASDEQAKFEEIMKKNPLLK